MKLKGKFKADFLGVERIMYEIDGQKVEGREIAIRSEQKYGNVKASREAVEKIESSGIAPFTSVVFEITIDTDTPSSRNYRITGVEVENRPVSVGSAKKPEKQP